MAGVEWGLLPAGVLAKVFQMLNRLDSDHLVLAAPLVSVHWRSVCRDDVAADITLRLPSKSARAEFAISAVSARFVHARSINAELLRSSLTDSMLSRLATSLPWLASISLRGCDGISDVGVSSIASCGFLTRLDLCFCEKVGDKGIERLAAGCRQLTSLDLGFCEQLTDVGVEALATYCTRLSTLDLRYVPVSNAALRTLGTICRGLPFLGLESCEAIDDSGVGEIAGNCHSLTSLDLSGCHGLTDARLDLVAQGCPLLSVLDLNGCRSVTDRGIERIVSACPITSLNLSGCTLLTDSALLAVAKHSLDLSSLAVSGCKSLSSAGLELVVASCTNLVQLDTRDCDITEDRFRAPSARQASDNIVRSCHLLDLLKLNFDIR